MSGYPANILEEAQRFSRNSREQWAAASLDCFLYYNLLGRISRASFRELLQWESWRRLVDDKIQKGHWQFAVREQRFLDPKGRFDGLAAVYALTPAYIKECYDSELMRGRYSNFAALDYRKRFNPKKFKFSVSATIPDKTMFELYKGSGLRSNPDALMDILLNPQKYRMSKYSTEEVWRRALNGWKILVPFMFHQHIVPSWTLGKNGWYYTSLPHLQRISKIIRMNALRGLDGEELVELDLSGCQLNIARALRGMEILQDPYAEIQEKVACKGFHLDRQTVKKHTLSAFSGRTEADYDYFVRRQEETDPREYFIAVRESLLELGYTINDKRHRHAQGEIMINVMRRIIRASGYSGLTVYDSLIVPVPIVAIAEDALKKACIDVVGVTLPFTRNFLNGWRTVSAAEKELGEAQHILLQA